MGRIMMTVTAFLAASVAVGSANGKLTITPAPSSSGFILEVPEGHETAPYDEKHITVRLDLVLPLLPLPEGYAPVSREWHQEWPEEDERIKREDWIGTVDAFNNPIAPRVPPKPGVPAVDCAQIMAYGESWRSLALLKGYIKSPQGLFARLGGDFPPGTEFLRQQGDPWRSFAEARPTWEFAVWKAARTGGPQTHLGTVQVRWPMRITLKAEAAMTSFSLGPVVASVAVPEMVAGKKSKGSSDDTEVAGAAQPPKSAPQTEFRSFWQALATKATEEEDFDLVVGFAAAKDGTGEAYGANFRLGKNCGAIIAHMPSEDRWIGAYSRPLARRGLLFGGVSARDTSGNTSFSWVFGMALCISDVAGMLTGREKEERRQAGELVVELREQGGQRPAAPRPLAESCCAVVIQIEPGLVEEKNWRVNLSDRLHDQHPQWVRTWEPPKLDQGLVLGFLSTRAFDRLAGLRVVYGENENLKAVWTSHPTDKLPNPTPAPGFSFGEYPTSPQPEWPDQGAVLSAGKCYLAKIGGDE